MITFVRQKAIYLEHVEARAEHEQESAEDKHEAADVRDRSDDQVHVLRQTI